MSDPWSEARVERLRMEVKSGVRATSSRAIARAAGVAPSTVLSFIEGSVREFRARTLNKLERACRENRTRVVPMNRTAVGRLSPLEGAAYQLGVYEAGWTILKTAETIGVNLSTLQKALRGERPLPMAALHAVVPPPMQVMPIEPYAVQVHDSHISVDGLQAVSDSPSALPPQWLELPAGQQCSFGAVWVRRSAQEFYPLGRRNLPYERIFDVLLRDGREVAKVCDMGRRYRRRVIIRGACPSNVKDFVLSNFLGADGKLVALDVAVDLDVDFDQVLSTPTHRKHLKRTDAFRIGGRLADAARGHAGKMNYRRHGSPERTHFAVYDKLLECLCKGGEQPAHTKGWSHVTRVELRLRDEGAGISHSRLPEIVASWFAKVRLVLMAPFATRGPAARSILRAAHQMGIKRARPTAQAYEKRREMRAKFDRVGSGRRCGYLLEDGIFEAVREATESESRAWRFTGRLHRLLDEEIARLPDVIDFLFWRPDDRRPPLESPPARVLHSLHGSVPPFRFIATEARLGTPAVWDGVERLNEVR